MASRKCGDTSSLSQMVNTAQRISLVIYKAIKPVKCNNFRRLRERDKLRQGEEKIPLL